MISNNVEKKIDGSVEEFYALLECYRAISPIYEKIINILIKSLESNLSIEATKVLYIYFSLLEDGNTCIPLNIDMLLEKWKIKWNGLVIQAESTDSDNALINKIAFSYKDFKNIFEKGIKDLLSNQYLNLVDKDEKLFVINKQDGINYLYANKYYEAKLIIEDKFKQLFTSTKIINGKTITNKDVELITALNNKNNKFELNEEQLNAVNIGQTENLIITGGPGTGKTTVVLYILWFLLKDKENINKNIYLAAPSGKAADRVLESLENNIKNIKPTSDDENLIKQKLQQIESFPIHRLLKYNAGTGKFTYNSENQFKENSIFVIDEASMIDISLFASFLQALPDSSRIFILGDVDQLPSVEAGAVLGELLNAPGNQNVVRLVNTMRFDEKSEIGKLKNSIQKAKETHNICDYKFTIFDNKKDYWKLELDPVTKDYKKLNLIEFIQIINENSKSYSDELNKRNELLTKWINTFFFLKGNSLCSLAENIDPLNEEPDEIQQNNRDLLWEMSLKSKVLCAEKKGIIGLAEINKFFIKSLITNSKKFDSNYFAGQLVMITRNQAMYKLYNGDTGIIVFSSEGRPYLMIKKNRYLFYPLSIIPVDAFDNAFGITIHKSQGSEYNHVLMFLPKKAGHPLLTNQIIYTAVTRAKESVTIVANQEAFEFACKTVIKRDTGICL